MDRARTLHTLQVESQPDRSVRSKAAAIARPTWSSPSAHARPLLQNADPLAYGQRFRRNNCRQTRNGALRRLPPAPIVLFGSAHKGGSASTPGSSSPARASSPARGAPDHLEFPDWARRVVFDPLGVEADRGGELLRLYEHVERKTPHVSLGVPLGWPQRSGVSAPEADALSTELQARGPE